MDKQIDFEVIISTCDKFSDLWDAHMLLMEQNWKDHPKAWLVTDDPAERSYPGATLLCAGEGLEITQRLEYALQKVTSEYILFTLDDYFLTQPIDNAALQRALGIMEEQNLAYMRLFPKTKRSMRREGAREFEEHPGYWLRSTKNTNYRVSLYPGLWRTDFMRQTLGQTLNAWQYEVALTEMADRMGVRVAISNCNDFPFLDVIRKGKVLRKASRYFKKNPVYISQRETMSLWDEWKLGIKTWAGIILPRPVARAVKRLLIKCGMKFYSPVK